MNNYKFKILGLDCPNCALKLEQAINKRKEIKSCSLIFISNSLIIESELDDKDVIEVIKEVIEKVEPEAYLSFDEKEEHHEHNHEHVHHHEHNHSHESSNTKKEIIMMVICLIFLGIGLIFDRFDSLSKYSFIIYIISYLFISYDILIKSFNNIRRGQIFDENFLMSIASIGALCLKDFHEAILVIFLYKLGEMFQDYAIKNSKKSIKSLLELKPDYANLFINNKIVVTNPKEVKVNDIIIVKPGEKVPLDGVIIEGESSFDTSRISGESMPKELTINNEVSSGFINLTSLIKIKVSKTYENSNINKIIKLLEESIEKKSNNEKFITKFSKYYTPIVVILALLIVIVPYLIKLVNPLITNISFTDLVSKALVFLVISCPCALVLSIPLAFFVGIGRASKSGILVKGSSYLEKMASVDTIVFDKTGTITKGNFAVEKIISSSSLETLKIAALADYYSNHPVALAIKEETKNFDIDLNSLKDVTDLAGLGVKALIDNEVALVGNEKLMKEYNISYPNIEEIGTIVYVAKSNKFIGAIVIKDEIKESSYLALNKFNEEKINTMMLSGDKEEVCQEVCAKLNINNYKSSLLPIEKVDELKNIINNKKDKTNVVFVGDGINDAPSLVNADIGISMGQLGSDLAIESSDVVINDDSLLKVYELIKISKKTTRIVKQNIVFSIGIKILVMILSLFGFANILLGIFADVGVMILAVLNATRILFTKK